VGLGSSISSLIQVTSCLIKALVSCFSWMYINPSVRAFKYRSCGASCGSSF
jgi:hypothetical protein